MKIKLLLIILLFYSSMNNAFSQLEVPLATGGPIGYGSWLWFSSSGTSNTSIQENYGLNISGTASSPVKIFNASLLVGYTSAGQNFGTGNAFVNGSVGIGTTTPGQKLEVAGNVKLSTTGWYEAGTNNWFGSANSLLNGSAAVTDLGIRTDGNTIFMKSGGNEFARFDPNGNFGLGVTSPDAKFCVGGSGIIQNLTNLVDQDIKFTLSAPYAIDKYGLIAPSTATNLALGVAGAERMRIASSGNVGIGTTTPSSGLTVSTESSDYSDGSLLLVNSTNGSFGGGATLAGIKTSAQDGGNYTFLKLQNAGGTKFFINGSGNVGINTTDNKGYMLAVAGTAVAESVTVKLHANWPDYVFKPNYSLPSLADLKTYIDQNHHLPDVPSAADVEKDGLNLGEMNKILVKKVEELTLYLIEKDKEMKALEQRLTQLENKQNK